MDHVDDGHPILTAGASPVSPPPPPHSAPLGKGASHTTHPPTITPPLKYWAKFSSRPSADQKISLAPLVPISSDQKFSSAPLGPLKTQHHSGGRSEAGYGRPEDGGVWTAKTVKRPRQQPAHPQYANYWAPLTRKPHTMPHSAQPQHTSYWAPRTRKRHQQEHRPQRPTERSDPTQHAKGRTGDRPGPRKGTTTRRNVTQGGGGLDPPGPSPCPCKRTPGPPQGSTWGQKTWGLRWTEAKNKFAHLKSASSSGPLR